MGISRGEQGIAEGGKLVIIKRTWEAQNDVRATSCPGSEASIPGRGSSGNGPPSPKCRAFTQRGRKEPLLGPPLHSQGPECCHARGSPFLLRQPLSLPFLHNFNSAVSGKRVVVGVGSSPDSCAPSRSCLTSLSKPGSAGSPPACRTPELRLAFTFFNLGGN